MEFDTPSTAQQNAKSDGSGDEAEQPKRTEGECLALTSGVYTILCRATGWEYYGSSSHIRKRLTGHRLQLRNGSHPCARMLQDFETFGEESFEFIPLEYIEGREKYEKTESQLILAGMRKGTCYNKQMLTQYAPKPITQMEPGLPTTIARLQDLCDQAGGVYTFAKFLDTPALYLYRRLRGDYPISTMDALAFQKAVELLKEAT